MMNDTASNLANQTLNNRARQVMARQKFLEKTIEFVESIVGERGKILRHEVHDCHTSTEAELKDFGGFSFHTDGAYSMFGGWAIKIWHQPRSAKEPILVLQVEWWEIKKIKVQHFDESASWQRAMGRLIKDADKIKAQIDLKKKRAEERRKRRVELQQTTLHLQDEAKRLGLS